MTLETKIRADAKRLGVQEPRVRTYFRLWFTSAPFRAVALVRIADRLPGGLGRVFAAHNLRSSGADVDPRARIAEGLLLQHPVGVVIGGGCVVGRNATLMSGVVLGRKNLTAEGDRDGYPTLGENVTVGSGAIRIGPVRLGDDCVVGANSLVLKDVPAGATVAGSPARILTKQ